jgi:uncharacterized coiled-coil DUF342 family protein
MNKVILSIGLLLALSCNRENTIQPLDITEDTAIANILTNSSARLSTANTSISSANETQKHQVQHIVTTISVLKTENNKLKTELVETKQELTKTKNELKTIKGTTDKSTDLNEQFKLFPEN